MTVKFKGKGEGTANTQNKKTGTEIEKKSTTQAVDTDGTTVGFKVGHTMNLGNYESAKFEVWLTLPSNLETRDADFLTCQEWADSKLAEIVAEAKKEVS